jgi:hypothetical protein
MSDMAQSAAHRLPENLPRSEKKMATCPSDRPRRVRPVFQKVTDDKYRLVVAQADTLTELAEVLGVKLSTLCNTFKAIESGKRKTSCYQVTWIDLDDE